MSRLQVSGTPLILFPLSPCDLILSLPLRQGEMSQNAGWKTMGRHTNIHTVQKHEGSCIKRHLCNMHTFTHMCKLTYTHICGHRIHMHVSNDKYVYTECVCMCTYGLTYVQVHTFAYLCLCMHVSLIIHITQLSGLQGFLWVKI